MVTGAGVQSSPKQAATDFGSCGKDQLNVGQGYTGLLGKRLIRG
jgi:hypothetical protein